jgi:arginase
MGTKLNLIVPEWQGYGVSQEVAEAVNFLCSQLDLEHPEVIDIDDRADGQIRHKVHHYDANLHHLKEIKKALLDKSPDQLFMLAGTCASEIIPISYLNQHYKGDLKVYWFDAHGDLNTPDSSPSNHFHGMPLRALLGDSVKEIQSEILSTLTYEQVTIVGGRDLDQVEKQFIHETDLIFIPPSELDKLSQDLKNSKYSNAYLHLDLDVLDPTTCCDS